MPGLSGRSPDAEKELGEKIRRWYGVKHCILTDCARSAYALYLRSTGIQGEIVVQSQMSYPLAAVLAQHDMELVFGDVADDFCLTVESLEEVVSEKTRAINVTHMFGQVAPIDQIEQWAKDRSIRVLSNMVLVPGGITLGGRPLASYGDAAFLSFSFDKPLQGIWGGALLTDSDEIYEQALAVPREMGPASNIRKLVGHCLLSYRYKQWLGPAQYVSKRLSGRYLADDNYRQCLATRFPTDFSRHKPGVIHPVQARFASNLIDRADSVGALREENGQYATSLLRGVPGLSPPVEGPYPNTYQSFPILVDDTLCRYRLGVELAARGIESKWRYYPVHALPEFAACRRGDMSNTERLWRQHLLLPVLYGTRKQVTYIVESLKQSLSKAKREQV